MVWRSDGPLLAGLTAFVTGGTRGIGWEIARTLAAHGADVAVNGRDPVTVDAQAAALAAEHGGRTLALAGDVADPAAVTGFYQAIFRAWKRLDVLVNNAGVLENAPLGMIDAALVDRVIDVNTKGAIYNLQGAARLMTRHRRGSIVNVGSIVGRQGSAGQAVYAASKAALSGLTRSAARELAPQGIRVNLVEPGFIDTDLIRAMPADRHAATLAQIGLGRIGTADDVARVVLFLASELSSYVTGQALGVDGGMQI